MGIAPQDSFVSDHPYLELVDRVLSQGVDRDDRTGTGTRALHGAMLRFDLAGGQVPLMTTKFVASRAIIHELLWFLSGETNIRPLLANNVHIWSEWPHARYVRETGHALTLADFEQRVLQDEAFARQWGDLGPVYGKQWRRWQGPDGKTYDQLAMLMQQIKQNPSSRRLLFHGWNVADVDQMALPPCHLLYQFFVANGRLSMSLYQRSVDVGLGLPFNLASAAILVHMVAQQADLTPGELVWFGHDVHIYNNHRQGLSEQILRQPNPFPRLVLDRRPEDLFSYRSEDFKIVGYRHHEAIRLPVAV